jgi:hypothetical protein
MVTMSLVLLAFSGVSLHAQLPADASADKISRDAAQLAVQGICPVSGQKLGSHGTPIKAKIGDEVLFLCCKGCLQGKVEPKHWATIHANFAKAQRVCPMMKQELPKNPKWTIVEGQIVYVCCPPCTEKVQAAPQSFLKQVEELYVSSLEERSIRR